jgi:hypothetical protein
VDLPITVNGSEGSAGGENESQNVQVSEEYAPVAAWASGEIGTEVALGFIPHDGENRKTRLGEAARFVAKEDPGVRRRYVKQRDTKRRGKLDVELRRLQRKARKK